MPQQLPFVHIIHIAQDIRYWVTVRKSLCENETTATTHPPNN